MKLICYFIVSVCFIALLPSCESHNQPAATGEGGAYFTIIKFTAPEYPNYVVVEPDFWEYWHLSYIRSACGGYVCPELFIGSSPYIALPNGYYATDWKWGEFIYPPSNILIDVKWEDVEDINQRWEYPSILISTIFLKVWAKASYKSIDSYCHIQSANPNDYRNHNQWAYENIHTSIADIPEEEVDAYKAHVRYVDSLQDVHIERIAKIIENGELEKVCPIYQTY